MDFAHLCALVFWAPDAPRRPPLHGGGRTALHRRWPLCPGPSSETEDAERLVLWFQLQVNLLSKFLLIAKSCYEQRNFATAMQILGGLEHPAVRQSPVSHPGGPSCSHAVGTDRAVGVSPVLLF